MVTMRSIFTPEVCHQTRVMIGLMLDGVRRGYTDVHYVFDNVTLAEGKNTLKAVVRADGKEYTDEIEWFYRGERTRKAYSSVNEHEHSGW